MPATRGLGFLGRTSERELLDGMLAEARNGRSAVMVIRGEPGIGKTALLRHAARQASGLRVAQVDGVQAEMELPFAGIHRLCAPMFDRLDALAEPQRNALSVALGVSPGDPPDRFLVALAVLSLLCATAEQRPLLCLVDDAQWIDAASAQVLGFVARRLLAESVAMVFSLREPIAGHALDGLPQLALDGLGEADARTLLSRAVPGRLDDRVRDRMIDETRGNPLALVELSRSMSAAERAGGYAAPTAGDLPGQLEEQYLRRVGGLPEATRRLILLAAADPLGDATLIWRAAETLSIDASALAPAADAGLLEIDDHVRFQHPLVRSAVYRAASPHDRKRLHEALAEVSDPDRRAWHRALATAGRDEAVATELERSAHRAQTRGGLAAAAAFLERATSLTADPTLRARRALTAAQAGFRAGAFDAALALVAMAEAEALDDFQSAEADLLRGNVALASGSTSDAPRLLLQAATRLEPLDLDLARETYLAAWGAAGLAGHPGGDGVRAEVCRAVRALPAPQGDPRSLDLLLDGLALLTTDGHAAAAPTLRRAATALPAMPVEDVMRWGWVAPSASALLWDIEGMRAISARQVQLARDIGAAAQLPLYLWQLGAASAWMGDFAGAASFVAESESVAAATGSRVAPYTRIRLGALRGREADASSAIADAIELAAAVGQGMAASWAHWAAAVLYNGLGRYEEAASSARQAASDTLSPTLSMWALPELVEAAARVGDAELARGALARVVETTQPCGGEFALGIEARSRALISDGAAAEYLYREAIDRLSRTRLRPELARAHLVFGEWLRQETRGVDAREQLHAAEDMFAGIGMEAFAERARRELVAAGARPRKRTLETSAELTPQEGQIARLARDGLTNSDIGAHLFLSPRTVEWHLHKVFAKLGINSRSGLYSALPAPEVDATSSPRRIAGR
jgi:DNA-binding CsgD family transcriptional regulator/tetratricopeptide (TPR) repeat protein